MLINRNVLHSDWYCQHSSSTHKNLSKYTRRTYVSLSPLFGARAPHVRTTCVWLVRLLSNLVTLSACVHNKIIHSARQEIEASGSLVSRARRILRVHVYCARRKERRGKNTSGVFEQVFVRCRNVISHVILLFS